MKLIATRAIRFVGGEYDASQELPQDNPVWVAAWLEAGSAVWSDGAEPEAEEPAPKAEMIAETADEILTANGTEAADKLPAHVRDAQKRAKKK